MKSYLIDVNKKEVSEIDTKGLDDYCKYIDCERIDMATVSSNIDIVVDDEGLLQPNKFFIWNDQRAFAGNGILIGFDRKGKASHAPISIEEARAKIRFTSDVKEVIRVMERFESQED